MSENKVGAGILNIITESLYDNPIVVFREYVQNSMDSILKSGENAEEYAIKIWNSENDLFFLDNGMGIEKDEFEDEMIKIGASSKKKRKNLGYKGIGRLSGVPYCKKLVFINISDYLSNKVQIYTIDSELYDRIKNDENHSELSFTELMKKIGTYQDDVDIMSLAHIYSEVEKYKSLLEITNSGFIVFMQEISMVLGNTITDDGFFQELTFSPILSVPFFR